MSEPTKMKLTLMARSKRLFQHGRLGTRDVRRVLPPDALARLQARVAASETRHSGEIRLSVEAGLPASYLMNDLQARDRAVTVFGKLRVWDTEQNNGVLIYLLLAENAIEIVADRGLTRRVPQSTWDGLVAGMRNAFRQGQFEQGLNGAIDAVDGLLREHFALTDGETNANELPDGVQLL